MLDLWLLFVIYTYTESTLLSKVQRPSDSMPNYFFHIPLVCPARVTTDLSLSLSLCRSRSKLRAKLSESLCNFHSLRSWLDGLLSFPDFIAIYLLTLEKKFTPFSPNQRVRERELQRWLSWRSWNQISALSPPRLAADTPLSKTAPSTPSWRSQLLFTLRTCIYVFICLCICMCVQLCMYVCLSWWKCCLLNW